jgi:oxygen-independent coproporphyrinogen-3 oxidase
VQSFVEQELVRTGRRHDARTVAEEIAWLREHGIGEINVDLIAGLPGQTRESWNESLDWIERLAPPHVSVYLLETDEDSRLGREVLQDGARYGARDIPGEETMVELYETAVDRLAGLGLARYEISNFARPGHQSLHNRKYWLREPYAGFGADAHSFDGTWRTSNVETALEYAGRIGRGVSPGAERTPARPEEERFFLGLRLTEGILPSAEEWRRFAEPIGRLVAHQLLEREGAGLRLSRRGVLLSNEVFQEFVSV